MSLSEQEQRCIELVCHFLMKTSGGHWSISPGLTLDDQYPNDPSPEVQLTNGKVDAAVEVKRLSDDDVRPYLESVLSLDQYLAPSCGGFYTLEPCSNLNFPLDQKLKRDLRREINRVACLMQNGEIRPIMIRRRAPLHLQGKNGTSIFHCSHSYFAEMAELASRTEGITALLDDLGQMEHRFLTDEARERFAEIIIAAAITGESQDVIWQEEWELTREHGNDVGVYVIGNSGAFDVQTSVSVSTERMIEQALKKFAGRRWAATHIVALESQNPHMTPDRVREALRAFEIEELQSLDLVLLVVDEETHLVWEK